MPLDYLGAMDIVDVDVPLRWNSWTRVQPVQFEGETVPKPRAVRLCCSCARLGDPVQITEKGCWVDGWIYEVPYSILHITRTQR